MNIFILDKNIDKNVQSHCDKHCVKMIVESCQMLANCYSLNILKNAPKTQKGNYRKHSYINHPCSIWVRKTRGNLLWMLEFSLKLCEEYTFRYNREHFCQSFIEWCIDNIEHAELESYEEKRTSFAKAFKKDLYPDLYDFEVTQGYREYYRRDKKVFAKWTKRKIPSWFK